MKAPRWWILLPAALLLTVLSPALRVLPGGSVFPDPWLLLLLLAFPDPQPESLRRCVLWVAALGALRAALSALSPWTCWAGLGLGLALRRELQRHVSDLRPLARVLVGGAVFLPQAAFDARAVADYGLEFPAAIWLARAALGGLLWAVAVRPARWRTADDVNATN